MLLQDALDLSYQWPSLTPGLLCGFDKLDLYLGGLQRAQLHMLYGPEGIGASSLMMNMVLQVARHAGVLYFTSDDQQLISSQMLCAYGSFARDRLDRGLITRKELNATRETMGRWLRYPVSIENFGELSPEHILESIPFRLNDTRLMGGNVGLVVLDIGNQAAQWSNECFARLRQMAEELAVAVLVHVSLPVSALPAEVIDDGMNAMPGVMWLLPHLTTIEGEMSELPNSAQADVVMLMHWSLDPKTGAAYPERRIMQVVRRSDRFHMGISLWHDPASGAFEEDEVGLCWGSFPRSCDACDWINGNEDSDFEFN